MKRVRIVIEFVEEGSLPPLMRWERNEEALPDSSFELLGRAFEVAQREEGLGLTQAIQAFFKGALMRKEDVADILAAMN